MSTFLDWLNDQQHRRDEVGFVARQAKESPDLYRRLAEPERFLPELTARGKVGLIARGCLTAIREWMCAQGECVPPAIESRDHKPIRSVAEWHDVAPPREPQLHWRDDRSAKELARAWFGDAAGDHDASVPPELAALFRSHDWTRCLRVESGVAELVTRLDDFRGEGRNTDLLLTGYDGRTRVVVGIEAKADEPFGPVTGEYESEAKQANPDTKIPDRVTLLLESLFGEPSPQHRALRYQLLHACAATLIEAGKRQADLAVFIVHDFLIEGQFNAIKVDANARDFAAFLCRFDPQRRHVEPGRLYGPFDVPGGPFVPRDIPLLVGKAVTRGSGGAGRAIVSPAGGG